MTHARNASTFLFFTAVGMALFPATTLAQENLELSGVSGGNLGSVTISNIVAVPRSYKYYDKFNTSQEQTKADPKRKVVIGLMQAAVDLTKEKKYEEALAKVKQLEAADGKTPEDIFFIDRIRVSIAAGSGDE